MARECLPRNEARQFSGELPRQIGDRAEELAKELAKEFPTVDLFDLEVLAIRHISFALSMTMLAEETIRQRTEKKED